MVQSLKKFLQTPQPPQTSSTESTKVIVFSHPLVYCSGMDVLLTNEILELLYKIKLAYTNSNIKKSTILFVQPTNILEPWINVLPIQTALLQSVDSSYLNFIVNQQTKLTTASQCEYPNESMA